MSNFLQAIKSNGLIILAVPNIWSLKGIITKITPTFLHIWYYKHILKMESAGKNDSGPFKTYLRFSISPNNIKRYAKLNNINVVFFEYMYNKNLYTKVKSNLLTYLLQEFIGFLLFLLSFGKIKKTNQDYLIILKK
jgi:hypothetical protein